MNCKENNCCCESMCGLFGCILNHPLIEENSLVIHGQLYECISVREKEKKIVHIMESIRPPKVTQRKMDGYYSKLKKTGIDPDKERKRRRSTKPCSKKERLRRLKQSSDAKPAIVAPKPIIISDHQIYLQNQTHEQFLLAEKHGWKIAKLLTAPEPNFHCAD